jgi:ankyrin repeat protein
MELGGKYTEGHLLVNSINTLSEKKYQDWIQRFVRNDSSYIQQIVHSPSSNNEMFTYLLNVCKLDPNEIDPSTGMNTLIAVCSEGSYHRVNMLLERFNGLLHLDIDAKTREGTTAMDWALRRCTDIANRLHVFIHIKRIELNEVLHKEHKILHDKLGFHIPAIKQTIMDFITA